ncbi:hypothetical protein VNI00_015958 [Paramarasmius palmivorus]|uniref:Uncharacterized protein n=1 Tax=Paramarasmius palmivorus TaxID=297713 RepID=A0AAW0BGB2_9AGAR
MSTQRIVYDDRDSALKYSSDWYNDGTYNASRVGESGTLSSTNSLAASVTFDFPVPAVAFYYYGIRRSRGGRYGICIDCDPNAPNYVTIDGVDPTDDGQNPPVVLYSRSFKTSGQHRVILVNQRDDRFPNGNSQITVDRFELEVEVAAQNSVTVTATLTEPTTPTQPSSPTTTSSTSIQVQTTTELQNTPQNAVRPDSSATKAMLSTTISSTAATSLTSVISPSTAFPSSLPSAPVNPSLNVAAIAGGVGGGCAGLLALAFLACFLRRKQRQRRVGADGAKGQSVANESTSKTRRRISPYIISPSPTIIKDHANIEELNPKRGRTTPFHVNDSSNLDSEPTSEGTGTSITVSDQVRRPRREVDAGRLLEEEDDGETLPPDYYQVFHSAPPPLAIGSGLDGQRHTPT